MYQTDSAPANVDAPLHIQLFVYSNSVDGQKTMLIDNVSLDVTPISGLPGDFNNNGRVDAADYVTWRNGVTFPNQLPDDPGNVTAQDYDDWRARFGNVPGSGAGLASAVVPEPATVGLLLISLLSSVAMHTRHRAVRLGTTRV